MASWQQQFFLFYFIGKLATTIKETKNGNNDEHDETPTYRIRYDR